MEDVSTLLKLVKLKDKNSFTTLYNQERTRMIHLAYKFSFNSDFAVNVVQELFCRLWEGKISIPDNADVRYLNRILKYDCIDFIDKNRRRREHLKRYGQLKDSFADHNFLTAKDFEIYISKIIDTLPSGAREICRLYILKQFTNQEIVAQLGISLQTVKNQLATGRKQIVFELKRQKGHGAEFRGSRAGQAPVIVQDYNFQSQEFLQAIEILPEKMKEIIRLHVVERRSVEEIVSILSINQRTVWHQLKAGKARLGIKNRKI